MFYNRKQKKKIARKNKNDEDWRSPGLLGPLGLSLLSLSLTRLKHVLRIIYIY